MAKLDTIVTKFNYQVIRYAKLKQELDEYDKTDDRRNFREIKKSMESCKLQMLEIVSRLDTF